jgi:hypothetical protein
MLLGFVNLIRIPGQASCEISRPQAALTIAVDSVINNPPCEVIYSDFLDRKRERIRLSIQFLN